MIQRQHQQAFPCRTSDRCAVRDLIIRVILPTPHSDQERLRQGEPTPGVSHSATKPAYLKRGSQLSHTFNGPIPAVPVRAFPPLPWVG